MFFLCASQSQCPPLTISFGNAGSSVENPPGRAPGLGGEVGSPLPPSEPLTEVQVPTIPPLGLGDGLSPTVPPLGQEGGDGLSPIARKPGKGSSSKKGST